MEQLEPDGVASSMFREICALNVTHPTYIHMYDIIIIIIGKSIRTNFQIRFGSGMTKKYDSHLVVASRRNDIYFFSRILSFGVIQLTVYHLLTNFFKVPIRRSLICFLNTLQLHTQIVMLLEIDFLVEYNTANTKCSYIYWKKKNIRSDSGI